MLIVAMAAGCAHELTDNDLVGKWAVDPDMPLAGVRTIDEIVSESLAIDRFSVVLFASFGALGLLLAAVGIYG